MAASQTRTVPSPDPLTMRRPWGSKATLMTHRLVPAEAVQLGAGVGVPDPHRPVIRPADDVPALGSKATLSTQPACPRRQCSSAPVSASQTRTVPSPDPLTMRPP